MSSTWDHQNLDIERSIVKNLIVIFNWIPFIWLQFAFIIFICRRFKFNIRLDIFYWVYHELQPFYIPALVSRTFFDAIWNNGSIIWQGLNVVFGILAWYVYKNMDDDDRWKKRMKKLGDKVKSLGHKLVVVEVKA